MRNTGIDSCVSASFIRQGIASGRYQSEADAVADALALWEERERRRAEILAVVDAAEGSLDRDEGIEVTEQSMRELAENVKRRGRARLAGSRAVPQGTPFLSK